MMGEAWLDCDERAGKQNLLHLLFPPLGVLVARRA